MAAEGNGPKRVRRVTNPAGLLDLWAEENVDRPTRTLGYLLAQTPRQLITKLGSNLERGGIDYAVTGAAAASLVAPFVTAVPVVDLWVGAKAAPDELLKRADAERVTDGENVRSWHSRTATKTRTRTTWSTRATSRPNIRRL